MSSVTIPNSVTSIGSSAFYGCSGLTSVNIPSSVKSIGYEAFKECNGLSAVYITDLEAWFRIEFEKWYANPLFYAHHLYLNDKEIKDLVIPSSIRSINKYVFYACSGITSLTIPNSVISIGEDAFGYCININTITIGNSVSSIGEYAFSDCSSLTSIHCKRTTPPYIGITTFTGKISTLYVPDGSGLSYQSSRWKDHFENIVEE